MDDDNRQFNLPRLVKTACGQRMVQNPKEKKSSSSLFGANLLEQSINAYDVVKPGGSENDALLKMQNPRLLALKTKTVKQLGVHKNITRPVTATIPDPIQLMPSLLTNKPISNIKYPEFKGSQIIQKRIETEKNSLLFSEDPVAYFSKRKDGRGHRFIYLNFAGDRKDPYFSPYDLVKVTSTQIRNEYFTMSASGVTHVLPDGNTDSISLDQWSKETSIFKAIRKLRTFNQYYFWKPFRIWKNFVMRQRFEQLLDEVYEFSYYNNPGFFATVIEFLNNSSDMILRDHLLSFHPSKKYLLTEFQDLTNQNREVLKEEYSMFIDYSVGLLKNLITDIKNPERRLVKDSDFPEIKRQNPNLHQLIVLERKKQSEKVRRKEVVQAEISAFTNFVRLIDYILLESLVRSCLECWQIAEGNVTQDVASIFTIEISFSDDGNLIYTPTLETLLNEVSETLDSSISLIQNLPRILHSTKLRSQLRETLGDSITPLFEEGPAFEQFVECNKNFPLIKDRILNVFRSSFKEVEKASQQYLSFFPIYKIKLSWNPNDYIHERGGTSDPIDVTATNLPNEHLNEEPIHFDTSKEKMVDISQIASDIDMFSLHEEMMTHYRSASDHDALFIDSRQLRTILTPIPKNSLKALEATLYDLTMEKIESISKILKYCSKRMKKEPNTLERFIDFCDFINMEEKLTEYIKIEIKFVDDMFNFFDTVHFSLKGQTKNPLHSVFSTFKADYQASIQMRDLNSDKFTFVLHQKLKKIMMKIQKYHTICTSFPDSIRSNEIDNLLSNVRQIKGKLDKMTKEVESLKHYQEVINFKGNDFSLFYQVLKEADFITNLFASTSQWNRVSVEITKAPLMSIDMPVFITEIQTIHENIEKMKEADKASENSLLKQLDEKVNEIYPYLNELDKLFNGRMQPHHWNKLFQICGKQNAYYSQIKIAELMKYGILKEKEKIQDVTTTSQGESQLEAEFQAISLHWNNVEIPLVESHDDTTTMASTIRLGTLDQLYSEINQTQTHLQSMLQIPFVKCISDDIHQLSLKIQDAAQILEAWQQFQLNWFLISPVFHQDDSKANLIKESTKFQMIKKRWSQLIKHTMSNRKLFQVCSFPQLLNLINENINTLNSIMTSLDKYLDIKRQSFPRLYFVSNMELITMISTTDFSVMSQHFSKLFMHIKGADFQSFDKSDILASSHSKVKTFSKIRVSGFVGNDGDTFVFNEPVVCDGMMEDWLCNIKDTMISTFKDTLSSSLARFSSSNLPDWLITVPTHIAVLTLYISFTRDIEECFTNFESNSRSFSTYESQLIDKFKNLKLALANPNDRNELMKISNIATLINYQVSKIASISEQYPNYSQRMNWMNHLRVSYDLKANQFRIHFGETVTESGYEYFGSCRQLIMTPTYEKAMLNILTHMNDDRIPFLFGCRGKKHLLNMIASVYGRFLYLAPSFIEDELLFNRLFVATKNCGSWICFEGIEKQNQETAAYLYNTLRGVGDMRTPTFTFPKTSKFFFLGTPSFYKSDNQIFPQIKSFFKPVAFSAPDLRVISMTKLNVLGFKSLKSSAFKIYSVVNTIIHTFDSLLTKSALIIILQVIENAHNLLEDVIHSNKIQFLNYYEDYETAEQYAIARALYQQFRYLVHPSQMKILLQIIYSGFRLFDSYENFVNLLTRPNCLNVEEAEGLIRESMREIVDRSRCPGDYITEQVISLYNLLLTRSVIFIAGPPNSGKSTVIKCIQKCFMKLSQNADIINRFPEIRPIRITNVYHESQPETVMYNRFENHGNLYSYMYELMQFEKTHHCILKFNGPITPSFTRHITEMAQETRFSFETFDSFTFSPKFHIFVETENFSDFSPSLLSIAGILTMKNLQATSISADCALSPIPEIIFNRAKELVKPSYSIDLIHSEFIEKLPKVIQIVDEINKDKQIDLVYIMDVLPCQSLVYAFSYMQAQRITVDPVAVRKVLALSFYATFSTILNEKESENELNLKLIELFNAKVPSEWSGFDVPKQFIENYPKPTLNDTILYDNELVPITNINKLNDKPITTTSSDSYHKRIYVYSANLLPPLFKSSILLDSQSHIFLQGSRMTGKTSFLHLLFNDNPSFQPIYINVSESTSNDSILQFLGTHTLATVKKYVMMNRDQRYVLIFEDVSPQNLRAIEVIRMLIEKKKLPQTIETDPKFLNYAEVSSFSVLVTSSHSIQKFPKRFVSHFMPINLPQISPETIHHIFHSKAAFLGVSGSPIEKAFDCVKNEIKDDNKGKFDFLHLLDILPKIEGEEEIDNCIKFDLNLFMNHPFDDLDCNSLFFPEILYDSESKIEIKSENRDLKKLKESLEFVFKNFQEVAKSPLSVRFYRPVIYKWACLQRLICTPGGSCFLQGSDGSGRYSLTRFTAFLRNFDFYSLNENNFKSDFTDAILKCIKNKHQCIVFIRDNIKTHKIVKRILLFSKNHEFLDFMSSEESDQLYKENLNMNELHPQSRIMGHRSICHYLQDNFHVVIAISPDFKVHKYPHILTLHSDLDEKQFEMCAIDEFKENPAIPDHIPSLFAKLHTKFGFCQNQFYDFIQTFQFYFSSEKASESKLSEDKKNSLLFLQKIRDLSKDISASLNDLEPKIANSDTNADELKVKYGEKKTMIEDTLKCFAEEESVFTDRNSELHETINELNEELADELTKVDKTRKEFAALRNEDIECLKVLADSPPSRLVSLLHILCLYLQIEFKYETTGKSFLLSNSFLDRIKNEIDHLNVPDFVLESTNPIFEREKFETKDFVSIAPPAVTIYLWIQSVNIYANTQMKINHAKQEIRTNLKQLDLLGEKNSEKKKEIDALQKELEEERKIIQNKEKELDELVKQRDELETKKSQIESILDSIEGIEEKCQKVNDNQQQVSEMLSLSFYLVYCGPFDISKRFETLEFVFNELKNIEKDPFFFIALKLAEITARNRHNYSQNTKNDLNSTKVEFEGRHILSSLRPVLVSDTDGIVMNYIQSKIENIQMISIYHANFMNSIMVSLPAGQTVGITDVIELNDDLETIIRLIMSAAEKVIINKQGVTVNKKFRVILFTRERKEKIKNDLLNRVCFVDSFDFSLIAAKEMISKTLINRFSPHIIEKIEMIEKSEFERTFSIENKEKEIISLFSSLLNNDQFFSEIDTINKLKEEYQRNKHELTSEMIDSYSQEIKENINDYQSIIRTTELLFESFSRNLKTSKIFTYKMFIELIDSCFTSTSNSGIGHLHMQTAAQKERDKEKEKERENQEKLNLINNLTKKLMITVPVVDSFCLLFLTTIKDREDYKEIVNSIANKYNTKADVDEWKRIKKDIFESIKNDSNILDIYSFLMKTITTFYEDCQYPIFPIETFSTSNTIIIQCEENSDPIPLLKQFMTMRNRNDSFIMFNLTEEMKNADEISAVINHGFWICLIYSKASIKASGFISDFVTRSTLSTKLIVICHTLEYLPTNLISKARIFNYSNFPSIRLQMMQIFQHYQTSIRSSTDPSLIKKMTYITSILFSLLNFRSFLLSPAGFTDFNFLPEILMKEIIDKFRFLLDSEDHELYFRNIRDYLNDVLFGGHCIDTFDRRKLRLHIYQIFNSIEKVSFVDSNSKEDELWVVPPEAPIGNYIHFFEKYPFISSTDILLMDRKTASVIENWNLGRIFIKPFIEIQEIEDTKEIINEIKIENFCVSLEKVQRSKNEKNAAVNLVFLNEIKEFNKIVLLMMKSKDKINKLKKEWKEGIGYIESDNLNEFIQFVKEKKKFLEKLPSQEIDARFFKDMKGLLYAHLSDFCRRMNETMDNVELELKTSPSDFFSLVMKNLKSYGAKVEPSTIFNSNNTARSDEFQISAAVNENSPFIKVPTLYINVVKKSQKNYRIFMCPIFLSLPSRQFANQCDLCRTDGYTNNFIAYLSVKANVNDKYLIANNACIVCQIPCVFM